MEQTISSSPQSPDSYSVQLEREIRLKELEIRRREVELPIELASLGLRGTLTGAIVGFVTLMVFAGLSIYSDKTQITGTHLCIMTAIIATTVIMYGAFVFQRSAQIAASYRDTHVAVGSAKLSPEIASPKAKSKEERKGNEV